MEPLFSREPVNIGRQAELDILKAVTIFMMIFMHLQEIIFSSSYNDRAFVENTWGILFLCNAFYLVGPFSFLFSMGCTIPFSRRNAAPTNLYRGCMLIVVWFVLNALRLIPFSLNRMVTEGIPFHETYFMFIFANDVLFFAGAFFLAFGFLQALKLSLGRITAVFTALFIAAQFVGDWGSFLPSWSYCPLSGIVWIGHYSSFPLLNWGLVVMLGVIGGYFLQRCLSKTKLYAALGILGAIAVAVIIAILHNAGALETEVLRQTVADPLHVHRANIVSVACALGYTALFLGICHFTALMLPERLKKGISFVAGKILAIYIAHWVLLPWLGFIPWMRNGRAGVGKIALVTLALYLVSFALVLGYERLAAMIKNRPGAPAGA